MSEAERRAQMNKAKRMAGKAIGTFLQHAEKSAKVTKLIFPKEPRKPVAGVRK
jgi:hypothetical protein